MIKHLHLTYSAFGIPPSEQVRRQLPGVSMHGAWDATIDRLSHCATSLHIAGLLTDSECDRARRRLTKAIIDDVNRSMRKKP